MATLTVNSVNIDLGTITRESNDIENKLLQANLLALSTENNVLMNVGGKTRTIIIGGYWTGAASSLKSYIDAVNNWVNQATGLSVQVSGILTMTLNPADGPYNVKCNRFRWDYNQEKPFQVDYTLELIQGDSLGGLSE